MKKSVTNNKSSRQLLWFIGIYVVSLLVFAVFHGFERVLIDILK